MRLCLFEDHGVNWLNPLTLTRPAFDLLCGRLPLWARQARYVAAQEVGALVRPSLVELCRWQHPDLQVNDLAWLRAEGTVLVNARWLPPSGHGHDLRQPHVALVGDQVAYAVLPLELLTYCSPNTLDDCMESWKHTLPHRHVDGVMINYAWELVERNPELLRHDLPELDQLEERLYRPANLSIVGPSDLLFADATARIDPFVAVDTTAGPVIIDRGAVVQAFSRLEGPCYIGPHCWILGARIRSGTTLGPHCRIGGEVEASIIQGYSNKYHDGFLGHSYVGEWVNLGAGTQVSDLRNDYGTVTVTLHGHRLDTRLTKVGSLIGDHTKTGLGTLLNTGSVVGAFCNLLPDGELLPRVVPSFCRVTHGQLVEELNVGRLLQTAAIVAGRRNIELTPAHHAFYRQLFDETAAERSQAIREREQRRLRRSA